MKRAEAEIETDIDTLGFPGGSAGKESACNVGDLGSVPGLGRFPGEGNSYPLQCSGLENPMDYPSGHKESDTVVQLSLILWIKYMLTNSFLYMQKSL